MGLKFLLDLLLPKFCAGCQTPGSYLCSHCIKQLIFVKTPVCPICEKPSPYGLTHPVCIKKYALDGLFVLSDYRGIIKKLIHLLKYKNCTEISRILADFLSLSSIPWLKDLNFITSIPLHKKRLKERGYNQADLIAKIYSQKIRLPYIPNLLVRFKYTKPQMSVVNHQQRVKNVKDVFVLNSRLSVVHNIIGIVDDVATTGATMFEAVKVLKRHGAKKVYGIVIARKN